MEIRDEELNDLITRCVLNDQIALKKIYDRTSHYLSGVIYRIVKSEDITDEVLQETFIQIWNNSDTYKPHVAKPLTWMTSIARYRALDRLEKEKRYSTRFDLNNERLNEEPDKTNKTPLALVEGEQINQRLDQCLNKLEPTVKKCIKLAYLEGYSRDEIAQQLNANTNTVKSWLRRGSIKLKGCLEANLN